MSDLSVATLKQLMHSTTDIQTGKRFRWNTTVAVAAPGVPGGLLQVPDQSSIRRATHLHPLRTRRALLAKLNPGIDLEIALRYYAAQPEIREPFRLLECPPRSRPSPLAALA
jgi:hypothetical protein